MVPMQLYIHMYVCIWEFPKYGVPYLYVYKYIYIHTYIHVHMYICIYIDMNKVMYRCIYMQE